MNPFIRSAVIKLANEAQFFDFDGKGNPTADFSKSYRACLVLKGSSQKLLRTAVQTGSQLDKKKSQTISNENEPSQMDQQKLSPLDQEKLQTIFNVSEPYPDFFKLEWFSKLKNLKVLYLGRWQNSAKHHIEVESIEFLKGLRSMKFLRFFSLQGISRITALPDSVCKLSSLRILDLRACLNLEVIPDEIGSLKKLTHLDISECYLLDYISKGIKLLLELQVLKGFVVGNRISADSCTLEELSGLRKLGKLSIYTNSKTFPTDKQVNTLQRFEKLQKLTIEWGGEADSNAKQEKGATQRFAATTTSPKKSGDTKKDKVVAQPTAATTTSPKKSADDKEQDNVKQGARPNLNDFKELEKLDLQCYPQMTAPSWLIPGKFDRLKKLYIRGGKLQNLGQSQENDKWKVKILRLKFLSNLKMDWRELRASFPDLIFLEKFNCPKLTLFPCDENGIWLQQ